MQHLQVFQARFDVEKLAEKGIELELHVRDGSGWPGVWNGHAELGIH
jgi:hypothetical protein